MPKSFCFLRFRFNGFAFCSLYFEELSCIPYSCEDILPASNIVHQIRIYKTCMLQGSKRLILWKRCNGRKSRWFFVRYEIATLGIQKIIKKFEKWRLILFKSSQSCIQNLLALKRWSYADFHANMFMPYDSASSARDSCELNFLEGSFMEVFISQTRS